MPKQDNSLNSPKQYKQVYIGIDVHKTSWKVCVCTDEHIFKPFSMNPSPEELNRHLRKTYPSSHYCSVYEAGFCGFSPHRRLVELGIENIVINPADVPSSGKERSMKTDSVDAKKLAVMLRSKALHPIAIPSIALEAERELLRLRTTTVKDLTRVYNRVKLLLHKHGMPIPQELTRASLSWSGAFLAWLDQLADQSYPFSSALKMHLGTIRFSRIQLTSLTQQVRKLSQSPSYSEEFGLITSVPGIGLVVGMTLLTQLRPIQRFPSLDKLCAYMGLIPSVHSSGSRESVGSMIQRGHKRLAALLIEASWKAIKMDPSLQAYFTHLVTQRMKKNKAIIRIARKLLNRIRYVLIHKKAYRVGVTAT